MDSFKRSWPIILFILFSSCIMSDLELAQESNKKNPFRELSLGKVIYGADNRYDVFDYPKEKFQKFARSTAAQISKDLLSKEGGFFSLTSKKLFENGICKKERFSEQPSPANCSGFLIREDLLVTAGHCVQSEEDCFDYHWVFGFKKNSKNQVVKEFPFEDVYFCQKVIVAKYDPLEKIDYALIKLDRPVQMREPLPFRKKGKIEDQSELVVIGHPSGLPTKIADNARVRENGDPLFFNANLDTFQGNSGSPVFNKETGLVEGILVRGDTDYITEDSCMVIKHCDNAGCRGEDVTRITLLKDIDEIIDSSLKRKYALEGHSKVEVRDLSLELPSKGSFEYHFLLKANEPIKSIKLSIEVFHPMIPELKIYLIHPSGKEVLLNDYPKNFSYLVWERKLFEEKGSYGPLEPFLSLRAQGIWTLKIVDGVPFDKGSLEAFSFSINDEF